MTAPVMESLAIIPARGGSKGIPRKNLQLLAGKPLIGWTVEAALEARYVSRVVVSTDDFDIAATAERFRAEIVMRPPEISGDSASSEGALLHTLKYLQDTEGYEPDIVAFLQCTAPLTLPEDIDGTVQALLTDNADSALAVTPFHYFLWSQGENDDAQGVNHDKRTRPLRQDREPQYLEAGSVYVMRAKGFIQVKHRFFGKTSLHVIPHYRSLEIDDPEDLFVAEALMLRRRQQSRIRVLPEHVDALVLDFDGVFTDNRVLVFQDGREAVVCNRSDGWGLSELGNLNVPIAVLSSEENPVVKARCDKLRIECMHGVKDKLSLLKKWLESRAIDPAHVVYVGNDVNDVGCLQAVGCGVVVSDAHPTARAAARIVLSSPGGAGAIREITDLIVEL